MNEIDKLINKVNKKYDTDVITKGNKIIDMPRIPTGSFSLDVELGGGIPIGRITTVSGEFSDGKTSIVLKAVGEFQKRWPEKEIVWIDAEGAWDSRWSKTLGVDPQKIYLVHPEYSQQAFDIAEQCITADVGLLVIDSMAALIPKEEAEATMEDWQVGLAARVNGKFVRKMHSALNAAKMELPPTVILINQLRENIGYSGQSEPGGRAMKYAPAVKIRLKKGDLYPKPRSNYDQSVIPKAQQVKFYVEKNKTAPPFTRGHFWFYFDSLDEFRPKGHIDTLEELIRYAKKYEIINQRGKMFDLPSSNGTGEVLTFEGSNRLAEHIRENKGTQLFIAETVTAKVKEEHGKTEELLQKQDNKKEREPVRKESEGVSSERIRSNTLG